MLRHHHKRRIACPMQVDIFLIHELPKFAKSYMVNDKRAVKEGLIHRAPKDAVSFERCLGSSPFWCSGVSASHLTCATHLAVLAPRFSARAFTRVRTAVRAS